MSDSQQKLYEAASALIDRIATDETFREALKIDGARAMEESGMNNHLGGILADLEEVSGFAFGALGGIGDIGGTTILASSPPSVHSCSCDHKLSAFAELKRWG